MSKPVANRTEPQRDWLVLAAEPVARLRLGIVQGTVRDACLQQGERLDMPASLARPTPTKSLKAS